MISKTHAIYVPYWNGEMAVQAAEVFPGSIVSRGVRVISEGRFAGHRMSCGQQWRRELAAWRSQRVVLYSREDGRVVCVRDSTWR